MSINSFDQDVLFFFTQYFFEGDYYRDLTFDFELQIERVFGNFSEEIYEHIPKQLQKLVLGNAKAVENPNFEVAWV